MNRSAPDGPPGPDSRSSDDGRSVREGDVAGRRTVPGDLGEELELIGDPVVDVRALSPLSGDAVRRRLTAPSLPRALDLLGIRDPDRSALESVIPRALDDPAIVSEVAAAATMLRRSAGLHAPVADLVAHRERWSALQERIVPGQGLIAILGHLAATDAALAFHAARGIPSDQSWASLADLGQQMRVHRRAYGQLGLGTAAWTAMIWTGRLLDVGRLQVELHRADDASTTNAAASERWIPSIHIPATGPLVPEAVDASFARVQELMAARFGDLAPRPGAQPLGSTLWCRSWLLSPAFEEVLGPDANLSAFARRWSIESRYDASADAAWFVFGVRPPFDPAELPTRSRLQGALRERLIAGEPWPGGEGTTRAA